MAVYRFKISFEDYDGVMREIDIKSNQTRVYEMLLPVAKGLDSIFKHFFGLSVIVVGVKE
jgi:hypothetical protein